MASSNRGNRDDSEQQAGNAPSSASKSRDRYNDDSLWVHEANWDAIHLVEAAFHFVAYLIKIATFPIWWPISRLKRQGKESSEQSDSFTNDLNRPPYK